MATYDRIYRDDGFRPPKNRRRGLPRGKRPVKKWDHELLYQAIRRVVEDEAKSSLVAQKQSPNVHIPCRVFREELEDKFKASTADVLKVLMRLNREGLVEHKSHLFAHDTSRDPMFGFKGWSGWAANQYRINRDRFQEAR